MNFLDCQFFLPLIFKYKLKEILRESSADKAESK